MQGRVLLEDVPPLEGQPVPVAGHDGADSAEFPGRFHGKAVAQGVLEVGDQLLGREALLIAAGVGDEILHQIVVDGNLASGVLHIRAAHVDKRPPAGVQHFTDFHHHSVAEVLGHDVKDRVADDDIVGLVQDGVIGVVRLVLGIRERFDVVHVKAVLLAPGSGPVAQAGACIQDGPVEVLRLEGVVNFAIALDRAGDLCRVAGVCLVGVQGKQGRVGSLNLVKSRSWLPVVARRLHGRNILEGIAEVGDLGDVGLLALLEIRLDVGQHLVGVGPPGVLRAGDGISAWGVQVQDDLTPLLADKVRQRVELRFGGHDRKVDAAALRGNADVALGHKLDH